MATEKRTLWAAGCWFIYCRVPKAIKAPLWDQETIYTAGRKGAEDQVLYSSLPRMKGEGVLGPAALVLGFRWKLHTPVCPGNREMGSVAGVG